MEIITIEEEAFNVIKNKFDNLVTKIYELCPKKTDFQKEWLNFKQVCELLNITKNTLRYYQISGKISYSKIENKYYFKVADVEKYLNQSKSN